MEKKITLTQILFFIIFFNGAAFAEVRLNTIFADHMVLQRNKDIHIYGTADIGEYIEVKFAGQTKSIVSTETNWSLYFPPMEAGGPYTLNIIADNEIEINDILIGDVWICSGQSNMASTINYYKNYEDGLYEEFHDIPDEYSNDNIRFLTVAVNETEALETDIEIKRNWQTCSPESSLFFSATAYFFGKELQAEIGVPIGLVLSARAGTGMGSWMSRETIESNDITKAAYIDKTYDLGMSKLYNGMIHPLHQMPVKGVIWFQGEYETSHHLGDEFEEVFKVLIASWRTAWNQGDFPFIFAQLSGWGKPKGILKNTEQAKVRQAQLNLWDSVLNTGMVVTFDGGTSDIHTPNKESVGNRLALMARKVAYHQDIPYSGPIASTVSPKNNKLEITFEHHGSELQTKEILMDKYTNQYFLSADQLYGFTVAGRDRIFHHATASITGKNSVEVYSPYVTEPIYVRYAWDKFPLANLFNSQDLPASPFELCITIDKNPSVTIFPNPNQGIIYLDFTDASSVTSLDILDFNGRLIQRHLLSQTEKDQNYVRYEHDLQLGYYIIRIAYDNGELVEKLLVE